MHAHVNPGCVGWLNPGLWSSEDMPYTMLRVDRRWLHAVPGFTMQCLNTEILAVA